MSNHDQPRQISRFGDESNRTKSGQMLFTMLYLQRGTPYVYMGEENGMTGIKFNSIENYKDIETINYYKDALDKGYSQEEVMKSIYSKGRDNSRTPFQWNSNLYAGFSKTQPWLDVNPNYKDINFENEIKDPQSIYNYTKKII